MDVNSPEAGPGLLGHGRVILAEAALRGEESGPPALLTPLAPALSGWLWFQAADSSRQCH